LRGTGVGGAISRVLFDRLSTVRWSSLWGGCRQPPRAAYPQLERPGTEPRCLFGLAPTGGYRATTVAGRAVGSYPTFSPLPLDRGRSVFCGPFRRLTAPRRYLAVSPVELGLSSERPTLQRPATIPPHQYPSIKKLSVLRLPRQGRSPQLLISRGLSDARGATCCPVRRKRRTAGHRAKTRCSP